MGLAGSASVFNRRIVTALGVAALLCAASSVQAQGTAQGQPPAQGQAQQPAPAPPDTFLFANRDVALVMNQIKPDQAANFESAWAAIKDKLSKSDKPDLKQLGDSIVIYKLDAPSDPTKPGPIVYLMFLAPPSKTLSYNPTEILYKSGAFERAEADALFAKLKDGYVLLAPWPLVKIGG